MIFSGGVSSAQSLGQAANPVGGAAPATLHSTPAATATPAGPMLGQLPTVPSANPSTSPVASYANSPYVENSYSNGVGSHLPSNYHSLPLWAQKALGVHDAATARLGQLVSYPNANIVQGIHPVSAAMSPYYSEAPAPMGIADFGLGAGGPFAYNSSHFLGTVTFNSMPNATQPAAMPMIMPGGEHEGYVGSEYEFGIQLNTILTNITIPGYTNGTFWTQNVVDVNDTGIHFVDDIFNFTYGASGGIPSGTTFLPTGCPSMNVTDLVTLNGLYQCVGSTIPISPADFPMTLQFYNNASVVNGHDQIAFGYHFSGAGGFKASGIESNPSFTGIVTPTSPTPNFEVNGHYTTTPGVPYDSELVLCGGIGGDNAMFRSLNGTMSLQYSNASSGGWKTIQSAYDYGTDTGETAAGVSESWLTKGTVQITAGPSLLHGFWGTPAAGAAASGDIQFKGTISPAYGFVFVTPGAQDPSSFNSSWVPTTSTGTFDTYLPPLPGAQQYYVQGFAPDATEFNGSFATNQPAFPITLTKLVTTPLHAPIYINGDAQAKGAALNITGSGTAPWTFSGQSFALNNSFGHINDYGFTTFEMFQAEGLSSSIHVNHVWEQPNSNLIYDAGSPPSVFTAVDNYTADINLFLDHGAVLSNETLVSMCFYYCIGSAAFLWKDTNTLAWNDSSSGDMVTNFYGSAYGIFTGGSSDTVVMNDVSVAGGAGVYDVAGHHTLVKNLRALYNPSYGAGNGIITASTTGSVYEDLTCLMIYMYCINGGYWAGSGWLSYYNIPGGNGTTIQNVYDSGYTWAIYLQVTNQLSMRNVTETNGAYMGIGLTAASHTTLDWFNATGGDYASFESGYSNYTNVSHVVLSDLSYGLVTDWDAWVNVTDMQANDSYYYAISTGNDTQVAVSNFDANSTTAGFYGQYTDHVTIQRSVFNFWTDPATGTSMSYGVELAHGNYVTLNEITCWFQNSSTLYGIWLDYVNNVAASNLAGTMVAPWSTNQAYVFMGDYGSNYNINTVTATGTSTEPVYGVALVYVTPSTISTVTAAWGYGVLAYFSPHVTVSSVSANRWGGVYLMYSDNSSVTGTVVTNESLAVYLIYSGWSTVTNTVASVQSWGVWIEYSSYTTITDTKVSWSIGVGVLYGSNDAVTGVTATNATLGTAWSQYNYFGNLMTAVYAYQTYKTTIGSVTATNYEAGLYDIGSENLLADSVTATTTDYGAMLNGTYWSDFSNLNFVQDGIGLQMNANAHSNWVTLSQFTNDTGYGVDIESGVGNVVWDSSFVGDNGATATYSPLHIQAWSVSNNFFNSSGQVGNFWADWHSFNAQGRLNPYYLSDGVWDYYPLGAHEGDTAVYFYEKGLPAGTTWSVVLNSKTYATANAWQLLDAPPGSSTFTVPAVAGYTSTPTTGTIMGGNALVLNETVVYTPIPTYYTVSVVESGLPAGTAWSAVFNGVSNSSAASTLTYRVVAGSYQYQVGSVAGYAVSPSSGTVNVNGAYTLDVTYTSTVPPTYTVSVAETGLASGTSWTATFNGATQTGTGTSIAFPTTPGTYQYQIGSVAGYLVSPSSGTVTVGGNYTVWVSFTSTAQPVYTVTVMESGLASGTGWSATVNGVTATSTSGTATFQVNPGTFDYAVSPVAGYSVKPASGTISVNGNYNLTVTYTPVTYAITVQEAGLTGQTWSATVNGVTQSTAGTNLVFYEANGSYSYSVSQVSGYKVACASTSVTVSGSAVTVGCQYTTTSTPAPTATLADAQTYFAIALVVAVVALVIAVLAVMMRRKSQNPPANATSSSPPAPEPAAEPAPETSH